MLNPTFAGIQMEVEYSVFNLISKSIEHLPGVKTIVELGTGGGSMAVYLGLEGLRLGATVHTFDVHASARSLEPAKTFLDHLGVQTHFGCDIFANPNAVIEVISQGPTYLVCDNGNKINEFKTFVPHLPKPSMVGVHDLGIEFKKENSEIGIPLTPILEELWELGGDPTKGAMFATWLVT